MIEQMDQVKCLFIDVQWVLLTIDAWTSENVIRLVGITFHWVMKSGTSASKFFTYKI